MLSCVTSIKHRVTTELLHIRNRQRNPTIASDNKPLPGFTLSRLHAKHQEPKTIKFVNLDANRAPTPYRMTTLHVISNIPTRSVTEQVEPWVDQADAMILVIPVK